MRDQDPGGNHRGYVATAATIALASATILAACGGEQRGETPPPDHPCAPSADVRDQPPLVGISESNVPRDSKQEVDSFMCNTKKLGASFLRFDASWARVQERGKNSWNWQTVDGVVTSAKEHGLKVLPIANFSPKWARAPGCDQEEEENCPPAKKYIAKFANFVLLLTKRHADNMVGVEIMNEPNTKAAPDLYAGMLKATYAALNGKKASDAVRDVPVIPGGMAPEVGRIAPVTYLQDLYDRGLKGNSDMIGTHVYSYPMSPDNPDTGNSAYQQTTALYKVMKQNGDGDKQVFITEAGAPTGGKGKKHRLNQTKGYLYDDGDYMSEKAQAETLKILFKMVSGNSKVRGVAVYNQNDACLQGEGVSRQQQPETCGDPNTVESHFGLLRANGSDKPAAKVFHDFAIGKK